MEEGKWKTLSAVWIRKLSDEKIRNRLLISVGLLGLLLIFLSELGGSENPKVASMSQTVENEAYIQSMEDKLGKLVEQVSGAGNCHVMVTLEQGTQYVFASESKKVIDETQSRDGDENSKVQQKDNSESRIVVLEENGVSRPLVETSKEPQVKGVVVVCEGGSSSIVRERVTEVLTTVLGIGSHQVCVVPSK
ncbi:MAG: hypothetical protein IJP15_03155 [Oscillospiraceae bacterium]|nr:hypothetical protein [Oscillospiraceae bacterium]